MDNQTKTRVYEGTPVSIAYTPVDNGKGCWNSNKVDVFFNDNLISSYTRNYHSYVETTFFPFCLENQWYALYSQHYTATRIAKLSEGGFEDLGGEDGSAGGFCPVSYYIPRYKEFEYDNPEGATSIKLFDNECEEVEYRELEYVESNRDGKFLGERYCHYGFLSGCIWGDDGSWKLRFIDLSQVATGKLTIDDRFGYFELPDNLSLQQCVKNDSENFFELVQMRRFDLKGNEFF